MDHMLHIKYNLEWIKDRQVTVFYIELLGWFREVTHIREPTSGKEVRKQIVWNNEAIRVNGKLYSMEHCTKILCFLIASSTTKDKF